ncbi:hypothetical protein ABZ802_25775 [Streptomyces sp. NPDC047737]|uniref:hypothetical protein n=1 Tax=unclassified Streptomyces TaxID=2593676 RepID=UPI0033F1CC91
MTDHIGRTTEAVSAEKPRRTGDPETPRGTTAGTTAPERTSAASAAATGTTSGAERETKPRGADVDTTGVPAAPRTAPATPPAPGARTTPATTAAPAARTAPEVQRSAATGSPLVPKGDQEELALRMRHAVTDFVENPRRAVEEAESTFDEIVAGLTEALAERRRALRAEWREQDTEAQTEELRVALQHYRDISEQLLKI